MRIDQKAPVILCPYLFDWEPAEIRLKFGLDGPHGRKLNFFMWQDVNRIGPEHAMEHCWNQFPDNDVIIIHTDMSPMPGDDSNRWYDDLLRYRDRIPSAGMIAVNLYYPRSSASEPFRLQCGGGDLTDRQISYLHGPVLEGGVATVLDGEAATQSGVPKAVLSLVRAVKWVTFGGVLIRRELLRACGPFDRRYEWAYVMDVDYCTEARLRGFQLFHVPVSLQHEESRTTRALWEENPGLLQHQARNYALFDEKWQPLRTALDTIEKLQSELRSIYGSRSWKLARWLRTVP